MNPDQALACLPCRSLTKAGRAEAWRMRMQKICHQSDDDSLFDSCGFVKFVSKIVVSLGPNEVRAVH